MTEYVYDDTYCNSCSSYRNRAYFTGTHSNSLCNESTLYSSSIGHCHSGGWHDDPRSDIPDNCSHNYSYDKYICSYTEGGIESANITFNQ